MQSHPSGVALGRARLFVAERGARFGSWDLGLWQPSPPWTTVGLVGTSPGSTSGSLRVEGGDAP